jgi:hypothetical protein
MLGGVCVTPRAPDPMAASDLRDQADARFQAALADRGARDPRPFYRDRLRALKAENAAAYGDALRYFEETLTPAVAAADSDPLAEWLEYGRVLAALAAPGRTVQIDATGRARDYARPVPEDALVLHLPKEPGPALVVGIPPALSPSQRAAHDLLVREAGGGG